MKDGPVIPVAMKQTVQKSRFGDFTNDDYEYMKDNKNLVRSLQKTLKYFLFFFKRFCKNLY